MGCNNHSRKHLCCDNRVYSFDWTMMCRPLSIRTLFVIFKYFLIYILIYNIFLIVFLCLSIKEYLSWNYVLYMFNLSLFSRFFCPFCLFVFPLYCIFLSCFLQTILFNFFHSYLNCFLLSFFLLLQRHTILFAFIPFLTFYSNVFLSLTTQQFTGSTNICIQIQIPVQLLVFIL